MNKTLHPARRIRKKRKKKFRARKRVGPELPKRLSVRERWKKIPGTEGRYSVSNYGRVRQNVWRGEGRRLMFLRRYSPTKVIVYLKFPGGKGRRLSVERLVLDAFNPTFPERVKPKYRDGDPTNLRVSNLALPDRRRGSLSRRQAAYIKLLLSLGKPVPEIAKSYKVPNKTIYRILRGETYKKVKPSDFLRRGGKQNEQRKDTEHETS